MASPDKFSPKKIIIRTPNWLGDLMMSTAFINAVLTEFPEADVDLIVKAGFETIPLPHRGRIIPFDKRKESPVQFGKGLRDQEYDIFYVLPPSFSSALMAFSSKVSLRIGYTGSFRGFLLKPGIHFKKEHRSQHLVAEYLCLIDEQLELGEFYPELSISETWVEQNVSDISESLPQNFITIAPGVIFGPAKQWPVSYFKELVSSLRDKGENIVVIGTNNDYELGHFLSESDDGITNLCGETTLNQLIAVLSKSSLLVSNDSGTMHIMAALQKPQVAIFGSTSTIWTSPVNKKADILTLEFECSPCYNRKCRLGHTNCLNDLMPETVINAVNHILKDSDLQSVP